jgi:hypothetical protein
MKKYANLVKNVHYYLCYLFLETADFRNAIKHGELLLEQFGGKLSKKTRFTCYQYLSEAYTMEGQYDKAIGIIDESQGVIEEETKRDQD